MNINQTELLQYSQPKPKVSLFTLTLGFLLVGLPPLVFQSFKR